jgi:16S rRNA (guanine527-N7)-methyltransferase
MAARAPASDDEAPTGADGAAPAGTAAGGAITDPRVLERLAVFRDELLLWNQRFNLTAIADADGVDRRLVGDALRLLPALDGIAEEAGSGGRLVRLVDVGSGAGFPGLALKIARPDLDVTLVEATGKKVDFLRHAIETLGLEGAEAVHARAEDLGQDGRYRGRYDVATARAVAALPVLMELCVPLLRIGGQALFPKGADLGTEFAEGEMAAALVGARIERAELLPGEAGEPVTRLVIAAKIGETPARYPRRPGLPAKQPLGRDQT